MQSIHTLLKLAQLRWTGHVTRMPDERLPMKVLYEELQEGKRTQDGQKKRYKDTLKASLKDFNIPTESWEQAAHDRTKWRCLINKVASQFEAKRICEAERRRKARKARTKGPSSDSAQSEFTCSVCNRQLRAKNGLYSLSHTNCIVVIWLSLFSDLYRYGVKSSTHFLQTNINQLLFMSNSVDLYIKKSPL